MLTPNLADASADKMDSPTDGDEETPEIIVEEGNDDEDVDKINVLSKDRSYMLSYIIQK